VPNNFISVDRIKELWGDKFPDPDFWPVLRRLLPEGYELVGAAKVRGPIRDQEMLGNLQRWYNWYAERKPAVAPPTAPTHPSDVYEWSTPRDLEQDYLVSLGQELTRQVEAGNITQEDANSYLTTAQKIVLSEGLGSAKLNDYFIKELVGPNWKIYLSTFAEANRDYDVYVASDGHLYTSSGERLPDEAERATKLRIEQDKEQEELAAEAQRNIIEAKEEDVKASQKYFDLQEQWEAPEMEAHRSVLSRDDPHGRTEYDIVIARGPNEARALGYTSFVPEHLINMGHFEGYYLQNLKALTTGFSIGAKLPEGKTGAWLSTASIWDLISQLTPSQKEQARQMALKRVVEEAGGEQPAGIMIRNERSPRGALVVSAEEYKEMRKETRWQSQHHEVLTARERAEKEARRESYEQYVWGGQEKPRGAWRGFQQYELPKEKTPEWMPQYVPGLTAGEPLRLGHRFPSPSQQQWTAMLPSQKSYLQQYTDVSRQVLGKEIPLKPWETQKHQMQVGRSQAGTFGTKWLPKRQRA